LTRITSPGTGAVPNTCLSPKLLSHPLLPPPNHNTSRLGQIHQSLSPPFGPSSKYWYCPSTASLLFVLPFHRRSCISRFLSPPNLAPSLRKPPSRFFSHVRVPRTTSDVLCLEFSMTTFLFPRSPLWRPFVSCLFIWLVWENLSCENFPSFSLWWCVQSGSSIDLLILYSGRSC